MKKWWLLCVVVGILLGGTNKIYAAQVSAKTTRHLRTILVDNHVNGVVVIGTPGMRPVVISNRLHHVMGQQRVTAHSLFPLASSTKLLTGMAVTKLVINHRLANDSQIHTFFPRHRRFRQITIRELMTHTSGIYDGLRWIPPIIMLKTQDAQAQFNFTRLRIKRAGAWRYSNVEYALLALIVSRINHCSYQMVIDHQLIRPNRVRMIAYNHVKVTQFPEAIRTCFLRLNQYRVLNHMSQDFGAGEYLATPVQWWSFLTRIQRTETPILGQMARTARLTENGYYGGAYWNDSSFHAEGYDDGYGSAYYVDYQSGKTLVLITNNLNFSQLCLVKALLATTYFSN